MITGTCGHELVEREDPVYGTEWGYQINVKGGDRMGHPAVDSIVVCEHCLEKYREWGCILATEEEENAWLDGTHPDLAESDEDVLSVDEQLDLAEEQVREMKAASPSTKGSVIMNRELFEKIFKETESNWTGDNCYKGLQIIAKYTDNPVCGAGHDEVWSTDVDALIDAGITEEDVTALALLNWCIEPEGYLYCFV